MKIWLRSLFKSIYLSTIWNSHAFVKGFCYFHLVRTHMSPNQIFLQQTSYLACFTK